MCTICYLCHVYSQDITLFVPASFGTYVCCSDNLKYGIGRWLCRVRLLTACISEGALVLRAEPFPPQQLPQPLAQSARPPARSPAHTRAHAHAQFVSLLLYVSIHSSSHPTFYLHHSAVRVLFVLFLLFVYPYLPFAIHIAKVSVFFTACSISVSQ